MTAQIIHLPGALSEPVAQPRRSPKRMRGVGSLHVYRYRRQKEKDTQAQIELLTGVLTALQLAATNTQYEIIQLEARAR